MSGEDRELRLENVDTAALVTCAIYAVIDDVGTVPECIENNNAARARVPCARYRPGGLYDRQVFTVGVLDVNDAPVFQTGTPAAPHIGQKFRFSFNVVEADIGDGLLYRLENAPFGMAIDAVSGEIRSTPLATQAGVSNVTVRVTDLRGASAMRTVALTLAANQPPAIETAPVTTAIAQQPYRYNLHATDPDGDVLTYLFVAAPAGMTIDGNNGAITWAPTLAQSGDYTVTVRVQDANGGSVVQTYTLAVALPQNHPPDIFSAPETAVALGQRYQYLATASDADGDALQFQLLDGPAGMAVDTVTGLIVWQPRTDQVGAHTVRLQVADGRGGVDVQEFTVLVSAGVDGGNHPPTVTSVPQTSALIGAAYTYGVTATDLDGDTLSYALTTAPVGMTIDARTGLLSWTPTSAQAGLNAVTIEVSDGRGGTATQSFSTLASTVAGGNGGNRPPAISSDPLTMVTLGQTYRYYLTATDPDGDALSYELLQAPSGMTIDATTGVIAGRRRRSAQSPCRRASMTAAAARRCRPLLSRPSLRTARSMTGRWCLRRRSAMPWSACPTTCS